MSEDIQQNPIFAVFHPVGGRKKVNIDELSEHELRVLQVSGWCQSPLEFWSAEEVAKKVAEGFFNREHEWKREYESVIQAGSQSEKHPAADSVGADSGGEDIHSEDAQGDSGDGAVGRSEAENTRPEVKALPWPGSGLQDKTPVGRESEGGSIQRSKEAAPASGVRRGSGKSRKRQ